MNKHKRAYYRNKYYYIMDNNSKIVLHARRALPSVYSNQTIHFYLTTCLLHYTRIDTAYSYFVFAMRTLGNVLYSGQKNAKIFLQSAYERLTELNLYLQSFHHKCRNM